MARHPNVLLIVADQHRWDCVGAAGKLPVRTPHLDRLAAQGAFFEHAFTPAPVCAPARQALLTGRWPDSLGALWNNDFIPTATARPRPELYTAALARAGYRCALLGKWNSSMDHPPADFGFHEHGDWADHARLMADRYPGLAFRNRWMGEPSPVALEDSASHFMARRACGLMRGWAAAEQPFFLRVDFTNPHPPCRPSEPFGSLYDPDRLPPWESFGDPLIGKPYIQRQQVVNWGLEGLGWDDWKGCAAAYYGMVSQVDDAVGRMVGCLDGLGLLDDTVVVYTSDHGDLCGGHGMFDKHYVLYDDVTRVPLIVRYPAAVGQGLRVPEYVSNCLDLGATLGELCAVAADPGHGRSLAPLLRGERQPRRDCALSAANGQQFGLYSQRSIRTDDWLYVWNMTDTDELYDVGTDPGQHVNRIADPALADTVSGLRRRLHAGLTALDDPFVRAGWLDDQLLRDRKL